MAFQLVVCWDGAGGSAKRKLMKKDYKAGRKPIRLNRAVRNMSEEDERDNKIWQQTRLIEYFNHMPVMQFMFDSTEADDVIAYLSTMPELKQAEKLILSSDKDFFQLLDGKTILYRPIQKEILNRKAIIDRFDIHPNNFAMARAMVGDKSDNIEGVGGLGLKTVSKRFPFMREEKPATIEDVVTHCKTALQEKTIKAYQNVLDKQSVLKRNYRMMQLYAPILPIEAKMHIRQVVDTPDMSFNKTEVLKMMTQDGFGEVNFVDLFQHFKKMSVDQA